MKISVIMPAYNAEKYIGEAIESILNQTFSDFELYIIDDGSEDETLNIIKRYSKIDKRIKYLSRENKGLPQTLNELIELSSGKYIARMDADDYSVPTRLEKQFEYLEANPDVSVVGCRAKIRGVDKYIFNTIYDNSSIRAIRMMFGNNGVAHPSAMIRRSFLEQNKLKYRDEMGAEDYWLWSDIITKGGCIESINDVLLEYRIHDKQISETMKETQKNLSFIIQLEQMRRYGDFNEIDLSILIDFYNYGYKYDVSEYERVISSLCEGNSVGEIYDEDVFVREFCYLWFVRALSRFKACGDGSMIHSKWFRKNIKLRTIIYSIKEILNCNRTMKEYYAM